MSDFRWGILGTGLVAKKFLLGLKASRNVRVVAVGSRTVDRARRFAEGFAVPKAHGSYEEAVRDGEVDAFFVATPPFRHREDAELCLRAGKPVLVEKPFALSAEDGGRIVETARECGVFCMEAMWTRFLPAVRRAKRLVVEGAIGSVRLFHGSFSTRMKFDPDHHHFRKEMGGGALLDRGVYLVSLAHHFLGRPAEVSSEALMGESAVEEQVAAVLRYDGGALALLSTGFGAEAENDCTLMGTRARMHIHSPVYRPYRLTLFTSGEPTDMTDRGAVRLAALKESGLLHSVHQRTEGLRSMVSRIRRVEKRYSAHYTGNGYHYEAEEVSRCVKNVQLESDVMPLSESVAVLETMDRIRNAWSDGA
jgi:predicted dehydrogenase